MGKKYTDSVKLIQNNKKNIIKKAREEEENCLIQAVLQEYFP